LFCCDDNLLLMFIADFKYTIWYHQLYSLCSIARGSPRTAPNPVSFSSQFGTHLHHCLYWTVLRLNLYKKKCHLLSPALVCGTFYVLSFIYAKLVIIHLLSAPSPSSTPEPTNSSLRDCFELLSCRHCLSVCTSALLYPLPQQQHLCTWIASAPNRLLYASHSI
jgi:hypothetical protein